MTAAGSLGADPASAQAETSLVEALQAGEPQAYERFVRAHVGRVKAVAERYLRNEEDAKRFYDWALTAEVQSRAQTVNSFQLPSNKAATQSPLAPDLSTIKLIDYDFAKYGSSEERRRLLKKWDDEVASLPQ